MVIRILRKEDEEEKYEVVEGNQVVYRVVDWWLEPEPDNQDEDAANDPQLLAGGGCGGRGGEGARAAEGAGDEPVRGRQRERVPVRAVEGRGVEGGMAMS